MGWPSKKDIKRVLKEIENIEPSYGLRPDATITDRFKYQLCQEFIRYSNRNDLSQVEMAKILDIDPARVSEIYKKKIWLFTADRLIGLLEKIKPKLKLTVA